MPTYEYKCSDCGLSFEKQQSIHDAPVAVCHECKGKVQRLISGGSGFIMKSADSGRSNRMNGCSLEETGRTCCGADRKCGESHCGN